MESRNLFAGAFASIATFARAAATSAVSMKSKRADVGTSLKGAVRRSWVLTSIIGLLFVFTGPAKAITINPGDTITVSLSGLPGSTTYIGIGMSVIFQAPLFFSDSMLANLFDAGNSLVGQRVIGGVGTIGGEVTSVLGSVDNTGHLVFDQVVAPFDLASIFINGLIDNGQGGFFGTDAVLAQFVVTASTPVPAALPLFATGLGALGLLGWRRKRKTAALAA